MDELMEWYFYKEEYSKPVTETPVFARAAATIKRQFRLEQKSNSTELYIYGDIGDSFWNSGVTAQNVADALATLDKSVKTLNVHLNSPGGDVFEGIAIYNLLAQHSATVNVNVDALAASAASVIAMAGDTIAIPENAMMMIHDPWCGVIGNAGELRKMADDLDKIRDMIAVTYQRRSGKDLATIKQWMADETWMSGQECVDRGFATELVPAKAASAALDKRFLAVYRNIPKAVKEIQPETEPVVAATETFSETNYLRDRLKLLANMETI